VADEAYNDFLGVYNPVVQSMREGGSWILIPTFTYETWISLLIFAVVGLSLLALPARRGQLWMRIPAFLFSGIMFVNGVGHFTAAFYSGSAIAGVYTSPLLLISSAYLWWSTARLPKTA